ncbi:MAG: cyclic nucleotide-binding domain-containing protein, partial [bacterium]
LQMLYRQGMILPNHPNNTGIRPMIIGSEDQVKAQAEYIYTGNYGLTSVEEIVNAGITEQQAEEMMRIKLRFAFDKILKTDELIEMRVIDDKPVEIRNGVYISRKGLNIYEINYNNDSVMVDLNLSAGEEYEAAYQLGFHEIKREYFSVIHSGEGDGWDINRPCMGSILTFQGKIYLIDAGPNILHSLRALGIGVNEIEGIFHTHAHDDHFNGMTVLMRSDHKIKYYATPLVRGSVVKKLSALIGLKEENFAKYFDVYDLKFDIWNNIEGLEVMPVYSPHPVETSIMFFRALWEGGFKTYAHLADIASFNVLTKMITDDRRKNGISQKYFNKVKETYLTPVDIKKIDIGGGMIHGLAEDFKGDKSKRIILSHTEAPLTDSQKEIGDSASLGMSDVLISAQQDYIKAFAFQYMQMFFPTAPAHELRMLLNCPAVNINPGTILIRKGDANNQIFFILSGVIEFIVHELGIQHKLSSGSLAGELSGMLGTEARGTYRTLSYVKALRIPCSLYIEFLKRCGLFDIVKQNIGIRRFLQNTWLFGELVSCPVKGTIAQTMRSETYSEGQFLPTNGKRELFLIEDGEIAIYSGKQKIETLSSGDFFGEENIIFGSAGLLMAKVIKQTKIHHIPSEAIENIPIVQWKLLETFEKRIRKARHHFVFA